MQTFLLQAAAAAAAALVLVTSAPLSYCSLSLRWNPVDIALTISLLPIEII